MERNILFVVGNMAKYLKSKKALSTIVTTVILISVSMAAIALVFGIVSNLMRTQMKSTESCFGNYNKVELEGRYTCYDKIVVGASTTYALRFSIAMGDVTVDKVIIGINSLSNSKTYEITNTATTVADLSTYPTGSSVSLPLKNGGRTYNTTSIFNSKIDSIKIAAVINGVKCDVADTINEIQDCALMYDV